MDQNSRTYNVKNTKSNNDDGTKRMVNHWIKDRSLDALRWLFGILRGRGHTPTSMGQLWKTEKYMERPQWLTLGSSERYHYPPQLEESERIRKTSTADRHAENILKRKNRKVPHRRIIALNVFKGEIVMYTDENSDRESEYEERSPDDSPNITKKSVSTVGFRNNPENQNARPLALRSTQSFTGAIEELRFSNNFQPLNLCTRTNTTPQKLTTGCPCGCHLRPAVVVPFRTRERNTLALHVVSPEVLHYHGYNFEPNEIAMFWKKDCRMFLWKKTKMQVIQSKT